MLEKVNMRMAVACGSCPHFAPPRRVEIGSGGAGAASLGVVSTFHF